MTTDLNIWRQRTEKFQKPVSEDFKISTWT